jgi:hypothetical protein
LYWQGRLSLLDRIESFVHRHGRDCWLHGSLQSAAARHRRWAHAVLEELLLVAPQPCSASAAGRV